MTSSSFCNFTFSRIKTVKLRKKDNLNFNSKRNEPTDRSRRAVNEDSWMAEKFVDFETLWSKQVSPLSSSKPPDRVEPAAAAIGAAVALIARQLVCRGLSLVRARGLLVSGKILLATVDFAIQNSLIRFHSNGAIQFLPLLVHLSMHQFAGWQKIAMVLWTHSSASWDPMGAHAPWCQFRLVRKQAMRSLVSWLLTTKLYK